MKKKLITIALSTASMITLACTSVYAHATKTEIAATKTGVLLSNGTEGFYIDAPDLIPHIPETHASILEKEIDDYEVEVISDNYLTFEELTDTITNRKGTIIIEIISGTMTSETGDGIDQYGYYTAYDPEKFSKGDRIDTVFIYNPDTNEPDDILFRIDTLAE